MAGEVAYVLEKDEGGKLYCSGYSEKHGLTWTAEIQRAVRKGSASDWIQFVMEARMYGVMNLRSVAIVEVEKTCWVRKGVV